jgi:hypothetical protein
MPDAKGSHRKRAMPIAHEQISVVIGGRSIVEAYTKRRLPHALVIRHRQEVFAKRMNRFEQDGIFVRHSPRKSLFLIALALLFRIQHAFERGIGHLE